MLDPLFAHVPVDAAAKADLVAEINGIERQYHGPSHLVDLWTCHRLHAADAGLDTPRAHRRIACVIAFHDAVYDSQRRDNEERSAKLWLEVATRCQLDPDEAIWVAETIRATSNHLGYRAGDADDPDERLRIWFLDLDLTPLAETPVRFRRNSRRIRRESCHLTDDAWADVNLAFLGNIDAAPQIFRSPVLFDAYEGRARKNIATAIGRHGRA